MHQGEIMKYQVSSKLLVLYGIICGIFVFAKSGHCATVYSRGSDVDVTPIENKSSTFSTKLSNTTDDDYKSNDSALAEQIRAQRAALDSKDIDSGVKLQTKSGGSKNNCDAALRKCITSKCASNYSKCATDSDTVFSNKLNACKKDTNCTAHEFTLFTNEIKEDKKQEIRLDAYNKVITCGSRYNDCIITACGPRFNKCLGKSAGDKAIANCKKIATDCTEADSGLAGRIGSIFGTVRVDAEKQIKADEQKLYSLRDQMRISCQSLGAMFDERSLDCIFTANFFAGEDNSKPMASKKLYAGSTFDCSPDWFGIDITTFKENAYRETRAQTAASSAMLGAGLGTAVGTLTSGAIDRAIDRQKAEKALEEECEKAGKKLKDGKCEDNAVQKVIKNGAKLGQKLNSATKPAQKIALSVALESYGVPPPVNSAIADAMINMKDGTLNSVLDGIQGSDSSATNQQTTLSGLDINLSQILSDNNITDQSQIDVISNIDISKLITSAEASM